MKTTKNNAKIETEIRNHLGSTYIRYYKTNPGLCQHYSKYDSIIRSLSLTGSSTKSSPEQSKMIELKDFSKDSK